MRRKYVQCCGHLVHPVLMGPARDAPGGPHMLEADAEGGMHSGPCEQRKESHWTHTGRRGISKPQAPSNPARVRVSAEFNQPFIFHQLLFPLQPDVMSVTNQVSRAEFCLPGLAQANLFLLTRPCTWAAHSQDSYGPHTVWT